MNASTEASFLSFRLESRNVDHCLFHIRIPYLNRGIFDGQSLTGINYYSNGSKSFTEHLILLDYAFGALFCFRGVTSSWNQLNNQL